MARHTAYLGIEPVGELSQTAAVIGDVLGVAFVEDKGGRFDEFPAFVAEGSGMTYALLGVPDPQDDIRDNPTDDFQLYVTATGSAHASSTEFSAEVLARLSRGGRVNCWLL